MSGTTTSSVSEVSSVEISLDNGQTWEPVVLTNGSFNHKVVITKDGNYIIILRSIDKFGNIGYSNAQTIIFDKIPPVIGGGQFSFGSYIIPQNNQGGIEFIQNSKIKLTVSTQGGVTEVWANGKNGKIYFSKLGNTNLFSADINYGDIEQNRLLVEAKDGSQKTDSKTFVSLNTLKNGKIYLDNRIQLDAIITVYTKDILSGKWIIWPQENDNTNNPQNINADGYAFGLPQGEYYFKIKTENTVFQSDIITLNTFGFINSDINLFTDKKSIIRYLRTLPLVNQLVPPLSFSVSEVKNNIPDKPFADNALTVQYDSEKLTDGDFSEINLTEIIDKPALISFVSSWSTESQQQLQIISDINNIGFDKLVIFVQDPISLAKIITDRGGYRYKTFADETGYFSKKSNIGLLPLHIYVTPEGIITGYLHGLKNADELQKLSVNPVKLNTDINKKINRP